MKKRVGLARTLALQPEVILYDEPTTGLDPSTRLASTTSSTGIQRALKLTSVVVTHDMGTAFSVSDRLAMLGKGRILLVGTKEDFRKTTTSKPCATSSRAARPRPRTWPRLLASS